MRRESQREIPYFSWSLGALPEFSAAVARTAAEPVLCSGSINWGLDIDEDGRKRAQNKWSRIEDIDRETSSCGL